MARPIEMMRAVTAETNRFLSPLGRSVNIPEIPFTEKQVETLRYYNQYAGANAEYIPPGLTLDDLAKLGKVDSSLFAVRDKLFCHTTRGGWVMALYGTIPESIGLKRTLVHELNTKLAEQFGLKNGYVDFGNTMDHVYLKLLVAARTGIRYPKNEFIWTNEFFVREDIGYVVLAHTEQSGVYAQIRFMDYGPSVGASPMFYLTDPLSRPTK